MAYHVVMYVRHRLDAPVNVSDWTNPDELRRRHLRQLIALGGALALIVVLSILLHPAVVGFSLFIVPFMLVELFMVWRTRQVASIPDFRPPERVQVDLDEN